MFLMQAEKLKFGYDSHAGILFEQMDFQIPTDGRIGLIGANGVGKTTLLRLLRGELQPDQGHVYRKSGLRIGSLSQQPLANTVGPADEVLWAVQPKLRQLRKLFLDPKSSNEVCMQALEAYENLDGYAFEQKIHRLMPLFGWNEVNLQQPVMTLSGGEKTRLALFQLMLGQAELLLLDEPTNHLDQPMLDWLEDFLVTTAIPWLMVSHDRHVLEGCVETIWELEAGKLTIRRGNYSSFRKQKSQERAHQELLYQQHRKKVRQLEQVAQDRRQLGQTMEDFKPRRSVRKNGGICKRDDGSGKAQVRTRNLMRSAKAAEYRAERVLNTARALRPQAQREITLIFRSRPMRVRQVLLAMNLSCSHGEKKLFAGLDLKLAPGERLVISGPNGSGKSSLLEVLMGSSSTATGEVQWAAGIRIGYLAQDCDNLEGEQTVLESVLAGKPERMTLARTLLAILGFPAQQLGQQVASLSRGERVKVALAGLIAAEPEVLLLDEPTNHLELSAREALEAALKEYPGTLIFVSHDRWFRQALASLEVVLGS